MYNIIQNLANSLPESVAKHSTPLAIIYKTQNYSMFDFLEGNRNINQSNLTKIKSSISKKYIDTNAIICIYDKNCPESPLKIVEGQHRFEACRLLNEPISYVIDTTLKMKTILSDITLLNTASKEWDVSDFMNSESEKGNKNYILYREVYLKYNTNFDHEALFYILNNIPNRKQKIGFPIFKGGSLQFNELDSKFLDGRLSELSKFNQFSEIGGKRYFQKALNFLIDVKGFDINQMIFKLKQRPIQKVNTIEGALDQLSDAYNYKQKSHKIGLTRIGNRVIDAQIIENELV